VKATQEKRPVYDGFMLHAQEFIIWSGGLTLHQVGVRLRRLHQAVLDGDLATVRTYPFVERLVRKPRPRSRISREVRRRIFERDGNHCLDCESHWFLEVDHIIPVVLGGGDDDENLQTLCRTCNKAKGPPSYALRRIEVNA
jgi:5-methylcytosine-specific restriction endonuclease McrA